MTEIRNSPSGELLDVGGGGGAPTGPAGGDLDSDYPNPTVIALTTPDTTRLPFSNITEEHFLFRRSGSIQGTSNVVKLTTNSSGQIEGDFTNGFSVVGIKESGGAFLDIAGISDAQILYRSGSEVLGATLGGQVSGSSPSSIAVNGITVAGPLSLTTSGNTVDDGALLRRSGTNVVGTPGFYSLLQARVGELRGGAGSETLFGSNFDVRVVNIPVGSSVTWQTQVHDYVAGNPLTIRINWATSGTTGTVQWQVQVAAVSPGDAQNITTKAFGTLKSGTADAVNGTANGIRQSTITLTTAGELDNLANLDFLDIKLIDLATTGTPATIRVTSIEVYG